MTCVPFAHGLFGAAFFILSCSLLRAAVPGELVTALFPSGERVTGRIVEQNATRLIIESPVLGRIDAPAAGVTITRTDVPPGAEKPAPVDLKSLSLLGGFLHALANPAPQPGWTDWFKGWHGLATVGWHHERRANVDRTNVITFGEIAKKVRATEMRLTGFYLAQEAADKSEIDHRDFRLRLRHGFGSRWVLQNESTWTRNPLLLDFQQITSSTSLNYRFWHGPRGEFQAGPSFVWSDTRVDPLRPLAPYIRFLTGRAPEPWVFRHTGAGGQAHFRWLPLSWLTFESDASLMDLRDIVPGVDLQARTAKSRVSMLLRKPWSVGLRHQYNRLRFRGNFFGILPLRLLSKESLVWLDIGYHF